MKQHGYLSQILTGITKTFLALFAIGLHISISTGSVWEIDSNFVVLGYFALLAAWLIIPIVDERAELISRNLRWTPFKGTSAIWIGLPIAVYVLSFVPT
jgi:hypothetical protein